MDNKVRHGKWELINEPEYDPDRHRWFYMVTSLHGIHKIEGANPEEAKSNACLVSAAPSILEALEIAQQYVNVFLIRGEDPLVGDQIKDHSFKIIEAIKLAKGDDNKL